MALTPTSKILRSAFASSAKPDADEAFLPPVRAAQSFGAGAGGNMAAAADLFMGQYDDAPALPGLARTSRTPVVGGGDGFIAKPRRVGQSSAEIRAGALAGIATAPAAPTSRPALAPLAPMPAPAPRPTYAADRTFGGAARSLASGDYDGRTMARQALEQSSAGSRGAVKKKAFGAAESALMLDDDQVAERRDVTAGIDDAEATLRAVSGNYAGATKKAGRAGIAASVLGAPASLISGAGHLVPPLKPIAEAAATPFKLLSLPAHAAQRGYASDAASAAARVAPYAVSPAISALADVRAGQVDDKGTAMAAKVASTLLPLPGVGMAVKAAIGSDTGDNAVELAGAVRGDSEARASRMEASAEATRSAERAGVVAGGGFNGV